MSPLKLAQIAAAALALACCGCTRIYVDQEKRIALFQACMASAQNVASAASKGDPADVVSACESAAYYQALTPTNCPKCGKANGF